MRTHARWRAPVPTDNCIWSLIRKKKRDGHGLERHRTIGIAVCTAKPTAFVLLSMTTEGSFYDNGTLLGNDDEEEDGVLHGGVSEEGAQALASLRQDGGSLGGDFAHAIRERKMKERESNAAWERDGVAVAAGPPLVDEWTDDVKTAQRQQALNFHANRIMHEQASKYYYRWHMYIGIPLVGLSSLTSTTAWSAFTASLSENGSTLALFIQLAVGTISLAVAVLGAIQTFVEFKTKADSHRSVAAQYASMARAIEKQLLLPAHRRRPYGTFVQRLDTVYHALLASPHFIPEHIERQVRQAFRSGVASMANMDTVFWSAMDGSGGDAYQEPTTTTPGESSFFPRSRTMATMAGVLYGNTRPGGGGIVPVPVPSQGTTPPVQQQQQPEVRAPVADSRGRRRGPGGLSVRDEPRPGQALIRRVAPPSEAQSFSSRPKRAEPSTMHIPIAIMNASRTNAK